MHQVQLAASRVVQQVLANGRNLNQVLEQALHGEGLETAQRAALQDLSYGTLRFYGQLQMMLEQLLHKPPSDQKVRYLMLVALYQLQYGKSAQYAVVDNAVRASQKLNPRLASLINAVLRNFLRRREELLNKAAQQPETNYSYPRWWVDELKSQYGTSGTTILDEGNRHPPMTLRVNRRLTSAEAYLKLLHQQDIAASLIEPGAIQLQRPLPVNKLPGFLEGMVSVQDAGAQYAARLLDVKEGMNVLDVCAAPGGKAAHILELTPVDLLAIDKDELRLKRVRENLDRLKLTAKIRCGDAASPETWWDGRPFQRILADVPCSASGVVRRHPDIKWLRRREDIAKFSQQQLVILRAMWRLLAHDGKLLYATCSVFAQENEQVVTAFLREYPDACRMQICLPDNSKGQLLPNEQHDGFFYALLHKAA